MKIQSHFRDPLSLRVSVTDHCQLRCIYCRPDKGEMKCRSGAPIRFEEITVFIRFLKEHFGIKKEHITGGEPLTRKGLDDFVRMLSGEGMEDIALTTNGQMLREKAGALVKAGLNRVNVSLDSLNPHSFQRITGSGDLHRTLEGIDVALESGLHPLKLNTVVLKGINDHEALEIVAYGMARRCPVRFLELMPIGVSAEFFGERFVSSSEVMDALKTKYTLRRETMQNGTSSQNFRVTDQKGGEGTVGFISPYSAPFCRGCRRLRLTSDGRLIGCLLQNSKVPIRPFLHEGKLIDADQLFGVIGSSLSVKREPRRFDTGMHMVEIGG